MHCELIVPGLFAEASGARAPALEMLLARGRGASSESKSPEAWLAQAFGLGQRALPAGALTVIAADDDPGEACWARADPVHLRLMRDRLIIAPSEAFPLSIEESGALIEALNRHFDRVLTLKLIDAQRWCARLEEDLPIEAVNPLDVAGRDFDLSLPGGEAGKRWHALLNEAQMLLHAHPVNEAREGRGEAIVNSLWLWGVGRSPKLEPARWQSVSTADPVALGLARLAGARARKLGRSAHEWLERSPREGRHLVLLDQLRAPLALGHSAEYAEGIEALEADWFAPLLAALRAGRIGMVSVHVPDGLGASFETVRGDLRRFWRRPKALERYA